jgi:hypothetical protein
MTTLSDRLQAVIEHRNITVTEFERMVKVSKGVFAKAIKHNTGINSAALEKIISFMPEVNLNWLLTGQGAMLIKNRGQSLYEENNYVSVMASPEAKYGSDEVSKRLPATADLADNERTLLHIMNNLSETMRRNAIANENNSISMQDMMAVYTKGRKGE